jgi:hypothetical protein
MLDLDGMPGGLTFRHALALYPLCTLLHVLEEWPRFPRWARRHASPTYSDRRYLVTHAATIGLAASGAALVGLWPVPAVAFGFFALLFGPAVLWNACFHLGASVRSRSYCPGAVTSGLLYLPLATCLVRLAVRDGVLSTPVLGAALVVAVLVHVLEVGRSVFARW